MFRANCDSLLNKEAVVKFIISMGFDFSYYLSKDLFGTLNVLALCKQEGGNHENTKSTTAASNV